MQGEIPATLKVMYTQSCGSYVRKNQEAYHFVKELMGKPLVYNTMVKFTALLQGQTIGRSDHSTGSSKVFLWRQCPSISCHQV